MILGADPIGPEALMAKLDRHLPGHVYAKSAIDIALWDLLGKVARLPLYALLGGRQAESLPLYHSISCLEPDEMARIAKEAQASGIGQFQAKLGADRNWEADVARLAMVPRGRRGRGRWFMAIGIAGRAGWRRRGSAARSPIWTSCWSSLAGRWRNAPRCALRTGLPMKARRERPRHRFPDRGRKAGLHGCGGTQALEIRRAVGAAPCQGSLPASGRRHVHRGCLGIGHRHGGRPSPGGGDALRRQC